MNSNYDCCQNDEGRCKDRFGPGSVCYQGQCFLAHLHPVTPLPNEDGQCSVEFGYKTANIGGLCYMLSKPIEPSTWYGGELWRPVPIQVPVYNGACPAAQPRVATTSVTHDPSLYGFPMGAQ